MGYKQTEEVITDYFSELLSDNTDSESLNSESMEPETTEPESTHSKSIDFKSTGADSTKANDIDTTNNHDLDLSECETTNAENKNNNPLNNQPEYKPKTTVASTQQSIEKYDAESKLTRSENVNQIKEKRVVPHADETKSSPSLAIPVDTSESSSATTALGKDNEALPAAAYEQHKQRLEKMLLQVSAVESLPLSQITVSETSAPIASEAKVKEEHVQKESLVKPAIEQPAEQSQIQTHYQALPTLSSEWLENGRPNWAQDKFDILLIEVNGLQLAVPLVALGQIQAMDEDLTPLFGQSDWFMGLQKSPVGNIKTVNTAKFVMPERYKDEHDYKFVVSINGLNWGLAVDRIHQPIAIDPDSIRWRVNRSSRPWMAGMVKDHMCVLLDIPSMGELLQKQDKNHQ